MDEMRKHRFLHIRAGVYYFRRAVPNDLVGQFGPVIQFSLKTKDRQEALKKLSVRSVEFDARFDAARREPCDASKGARYVSLDNMKIAELIRDYVAVSSERFENEASQVEKQPPHVRSDHRQEVEREYSIVRDVDHPRLHERISGALTKLLAPEADWMRDEIGNGDSIADLMHRALLEISSRQLARLNQDYSHTFFDPAFDPHRKPSITFKALVSQYVAERTEDGEINRLSSKRLAKIEAHATRIEEIVGSDVLVSNIDYDLCQRVRTAIARMPTNRQLRLADTDIATATALGKEGAVPTLSSLTQGDYLGCFKDILSLAVRKGLLAQNPSQDMRPILQDRLAAREKRFAFDENQLVSFFSSDFYRTKLGAGDRSEKYGDWRFWLPLLSCFMGMRPNEACQLVVTDLRMTAKGTWYIDVNDDDDAPHKKTLKTKNSRRRIPLHAELAKIGFVTFVENTKLKYPGGAIFTSLRPDGHGNMATYALKRFNERFIGEQLDKRPRQSFYSFRHSFRDALRRVAAPDDVLKALGAWEGKSATSDSYGSDWDNPDLYQSWIDKVSFPGFDLTHLHASWGPNKTIPNGVEN